LYIIVKIAIAKWEDRISPVFDVSESLLLIDIDRKSRKEHRTVTLIHRHPLQRAREVADLGVDVLICGAISHALERSLIGAGIEVNGFICGNIDLVTEAYLDGRLAQDRFQMPGTSLKDHLLKASPEAGPDMPSDQNIEADNKRS